MSDVISIPEYVAPVGPMFQRLPVEITLKIIEQLVLVGPYYMPKVVDQSRFGILNAFNSFINIRSINKTFCQWIMEVFYHNNEFFFKHTRRHCDWYSWCRTGPCLPPTSVRGFLRRITISICLEDEYRILTFNESLGRDTTTVGSIGSVEELYKHSPGACILRDLTSASKGFSNLDTLHIILYTHFSAGQDQKTLDIVRQAGFRVRARDSVTIEVLKHPQGKKLCQQVADLIEIELGE